MDKNLEILSTKQVIISKGFKAELTTLLNKYSHENDSSTPDWILAEHLIWCLIAYNTTIRKRAGVHNAEFGDTDKTVQS